MADAAFVSVTRGASGTGPGVVEYEVDANSGPERVGRLVIADRAFPIDQPGPDSGGVCGRTAQVMKVITDEVAVEHCWEVTSEHLARIRVPPLDDLGITVLQAGDFAGLSGLWILRLGGNELTTLPEGIFEGLASLRSLYLTDNVLTTLPEGVFAGLTGLDELDVSYNNLTTLPGGTFAGLSNLTLLLVSGNPFTSIPEGRVHRHAQPALALDERFQSDGPAGWDLRGPFSLEALLVTRGKLQALPEAIFAGLTTLETLWLSGNELTELPEGIFSGLSNLDNLGLGVNQLHALPDEIFADLPRLGRLN